MNETAWLIAETVIGALGDFYVAAATIVFLQSFYDNGIRWSRKKALMFGIFAVADAVLTLLKGDSIVIMSVLVICYFVLHVIGCKGKIISRIFKVVVVYYAYSMVISAVFLFGFLFFLPGFNIYAEDLSRAEVLIGTCITTLFAAFAFYYIKIKLVNKDIFVKCGKRVNIAVFVYGIFSFVLYVAAILSKGNPELLEENPEMLAESPEALTLMQDPEMMNDVLMIFAVVCLVAMIAFPLALYKGRISAHYRSAAEAHEGYMQAQLEHFRHYKETQEETARFRHDIKNNLQCISDLLSSGKEKEAQQYILELLCEVRTLSPEYVSGDEILDCVIASKASEMKKEGIEFSLDGVIPGGLGFAAIDICNVFANALDNAIESCMKMSEEERYIKMQLKSSEQFRYVNIENPTAEKVDVKKLFCESGGYTTKKNRSRHGMGTYSIRRTAEKYGGVVKAECEDGVFTLEIITNKSSSL